MRRRLTEWMTGATVLGVLAALYVWHGGASVLYMLLLTGLVVISGVSMQWLGPRHIIVKRQVSESVISAGGTAVMQVHVEFSSVLPVPWLAVEDHYTGGSSRQILFPGFRRKLSYSCELRDLPRGVYSFDACLLEWGGLFGWFKGRRLQKSEGQLLVLPKPLPLGNVLELPSATAPSPYASHPVQSMQRRHGAKGPDIREYMPSDPMNWIHWKSSAKRGSLYTLLPEDERDPFCLVVLDRSLQGYIRSGGTEGEQRVRAQQSFEKAVSAAAGIVGEMMRTGTRSKLIYGTDNSIKNSPDAARGEETGSPEAYTRILAELSSVTLTEGPELSSFLEESLKHMVLGTRVIIVTGMMGKHTADVAARVTARGGQADFFCTALAGGLGGTDGHMRSGTPGNGSSFATAVRISRTGAGIFAVDRDQVTKIGLMETPHSGEGAV